MKKIIFTIFLFIALLTWTREHASSWSIPSDITFIGVEKTIPAVKKTVFAVQFLNDNVSSGMPLGFITVGSGFLATSNDNVVRGITCEHVIRKPLKENKKIFMWLNTKNGYVRYGCNVVHTNTDKDIAILAPTRTASLPKEILNFGFGRKHFSKNAEIAEGRGVIMIGYPLGIGLEYEENHPIIRLGIVSQFAGRDYFLIDATANQGYSGSPVFDIKNGKICGMVRAYPPDYIDLYDAEQRHTAKIPYNSGLGLVINADVISQILSDHFGTKW